MIKGKKGFTHLEIILSFVIFVGFLIFALAIFNPFNMLSSGGKVYLDMAERGLKEQISAEVVFQSIKLSPDVIFTKGCFCFPYELNKVIARNVNYNIVKAEKSGDNLCIDGSNDFYYLLSSSEFEENGFSVDCDIFHKGDYSLGLYRSYSFVSYELLKILNQSAIENYNTLKEKIKLPSNKEFSFSVRSTNISLKNIFGPIKMPPKGIRVNARDVPLQLVYSNGTIRYDTIMNVQVW